MIRSNLPEPAFYPLEELAAQWGCTVELLRMFATLGVGDDADTLVVTELQIEGRKVECVSRAEKARFEALAPPTAIKEPSPTAPGRDGPEAATAKVAAPTPERSARRLNPTERESLLALIGALAVSWCGADPDAEDHPYTLLGDLEKHAAALGVPILRGDDTNARLIREGIELLRANGYVSPRLMVDDEDEDIDEYPNFGNEMETSDASPEAGTKMLKVANGPGGRP